MIRVLLLAPPGQSTTRPTTTAVANLVVTVDADLSTDLPSLFASGTLLLEGEQKPCLPAKLELLGPREARVEIIEGRYHQVKRMFSSQGCNVTRLHRNAFGPFTVANLDPGKWRIVTPDEIAQAEAAELPTPH